MCKCSGAISSASAAASSADRHANQGPELLEALPRQIAALQMGKLPLKFGGRLVQQPLAPGNQDARPGGMFGLRDQIGGREIGPGRFVGDHDHFARPGDRVDIDLAEDELLGQRDEQIARPDDLIDPRQALDCRRPAPPRPAHRRGDRLRVTPNSWHVASRSAL